MRLASMPSAICIGRIKADLTRHIYRSTGAYRLRIRADGLGRLARLDRGFHWGYLSLMISQLEKLLGTPRDGALLRYSLGLEHAKAGNPRAPSSICGTR